MKDVYALAIEVNGELAFLSGIDTDVEPIKINFSNEEKDMKFMSLDDAEKIQELLCSKRGLKTEIVSITFGD